MYTFFKESSNSKYVLQDFDHFKLEDDLRFMFSSKIFVNTRCVDNLKKVSVCKHRKYVFRLCTGSSFLNTVFKKAVKLAREILIAIRKFYVSSSVDHY